MTAAEKLDIQRLPLTQDHTERERALKFFFFCTHHDRAGQKGSELGSAHRINQNKLICQVVSQAGPDAQQKINERRR